MAGTVTQKLFFRDNSISILEFDCTAAVGGTLTSVNAKNRDDWAPLHFTAWRSYTGHRNIADIQDCQLPLKSWRQRGNEDDRRLGEDLPLEQFFPSERL